MKNILVTYESNGYKVWDVVNENFFAVSDILLDEVNFRATSPGINITGSDIQNL